jgi:serine/threonine-protein kinase
VFPQIFGKYVLERELASGGMAVVYLATLRGAGGFEKRLVVKQIRAELASDEAFVERFVAEAKTTVELSHPNIVPVYELGVEQGVYFIAMELARGVTLSELLKADGPLSPEEGAYLGVEICRALDYAHRRAGIVHRDVTPRNVLVDEEGAVRLIDFGIAAPVTVDESARERVFGSPGHMPPEQLRGGRLTPATDVFAAAALLIEVWTGAAPFRRATKAESERAVLEPPPRLSSRDPKLAPLDELVSRSVAPEPSLRPQSAEDLARPLRDFLRSEDLGDIARRLGERVRRARRRSVDRGATEGPATPSTPRLGPSSVPVTPVTRPLSEPRTHTFATRGEVAEWTRGRSEPPPAAPAREAAPRVDGATEHAAPRADTAVEHAAPRADAGVAEAPRKPPRVSAKRTAELLAPAVAIAAVVFWVAHGRGRDGFAAHPAPSAAVPVAPTGMAPSGSDLPRAAPSTQPAAPVSVKSVPSPSPAPSDEAFRGPPALLTFTSDLPAQVTLDGSALGTTPVRGVRRAPGRHTVAFQSLALEERLSATIDAKPGQTLALHAEFTRATPALRIR